MKIIAISDTHGQFPKIPPCDLFIFAGDYGYLPLGQKKDLSSQLKELINFLHWVSSIEADRKIIVPGNHDFIFEQFYSLACSIAQEIDFKIDILINNTTICKGHIIYGLPVTRNYMGWAFEADSLRREILCESIPTITDILVTHSPPFNAYNCKFGCEHIQNFIVNNKPKLSIFGHDHTSKKERPFKVKDTMYYNVSYLDSNYQDIGKGFTEIII